MDVIPYIMAFDHISKAKVCPARLYNGTCCSLPKYLEWDDDASLHFYLISAKKIQSGPRWSQKKTGHEKKTRLHGRNKRVV